MYFIFGYLIETQRIYTKKKSVNSKLLLVIKKRLLFNL